MYRLTCLAAPVCLQGQGYSAKFDPRGRLQVSAPLTLQLHKELLLASHKLARTQHVQQTGMPAPGGMLSLAPRQLKRPVSWGGQRRRSAPQPAETCPWLGVRLPRQPSGGLVQLPVSSAPAVPDPAAGGVHLPASSRLHLVHCGWHGSGPWAGCLALPEGLSFGSATDSGSLPARWAAGGGWQAGVACSGRS